MSGSPATPQSDPWIRGPVTPGRPVQEPPADVPAPADAPADRTSLPAVRRLFERPAPQSAAPAPALAVQASTAAPSSIPPTAEDASATAIMSRPADILHGSPPTPRQAPPTAVPSMTSPASPVGISWVGAHGGAGASTFAGALGGVDVGHAWPDVSRGEPGDILLLARTHLAGLQAASKALDSLRTGRHPAGIQLVALVLVADAPGRLPPELWRRVRVLRAAVRTISVPWIAQWRVGRPAPKAPRSVVELAALVPARSEDPGGPRPAFRPDPLGQSAPHALAAPSAPKDGS